MEDHLPVPNSFPQEKENQDVNYEFMSTTKDDKPNPNERWTQGEWVDGNGEFSYGRQPGGGEPDLDEVIEAMTTRYTETRTLTRSVVHPLFRFFVGVGRLPGNRSAELEYDAPAKTAPPRKRRRTAQGEKAQSRLIRRTSRRMMAIDERAMTRVQYTDESSFGGRYRTYLSIQMTCQKG